MPHGANCHRLALQASGFRDQSSHGIRGWRAACRLLGAGSKEKQLTSHPKSEGEP